jgi:CheY-like chemotaxis protein
MTPSTMTQRVLLVDDEPALLSALRRVVERARPDAIVVYASDAETAVWQIETTAIRLVVTDMKMQGDLQAGWSVVRAARAAGIPVAVLTGAAEPGDLDSLARSSVPLVEKSAMSGDALRELVERAFTA